MSTRQLGVADGREFGLTRVQPVGAIWGYSSKGGWPDPGVTTIVSGPLPLVPG